MEDPTHLFGVELGKLLVWHVIYEKVVSDLRISINSFLMSLSHSLRKDSRVFGIEKQIYPSKFTVFIAVVPNTCENAPLCVESLN